MKTMNQYVYAAALGAVASISFAAMPAGAQSGGTVYSPGCLGQAAQRSAPCTPRHAWERWDDGTPARANGSSRAPTPAQGDFPLSFQSYNMLYGFGR